MKRRIFLRLVGGGLLQPAASFAASRPVFNNGELLADGSLGWSTGGGDPLHHELTANGYKAALALPRLNLSPALQSQIRDAILHRPGERIDLRMYSGQRLNAVMMSGNGWLAMRPLILTNRWHRHVFGATNWYVTSEENGRIQRWQVLVADVCGNLVLIPRGGALPCECDPRLDACSFH